jgi:hypothetical protein
MQRVMVACLALATVATRRAFCEVKASALRDKPGSYFSTISQNRSV